MSSLELPKTYEPKLIEEKCASLWEQLLLFRANAQSKKPPYCIVIPPPNVTGVLHMGHALVNTLQDILVRWKRMSGFETLWVPGTDHAGIATQTVVERQLIAKTGKRRKEFSREEFLSHVWAWKEQSGGQILTQLKKLGCSCDFSRLAFTMDEPRNRAVRTMFKTMFDDGLIYRGDYLVNWDPVTQTALADDEVEYEDRASFLWRFRYPIDGEKECFIEIATTRPETMLGDVAVAVHPNDERYKTLIGKKVALPLSNRLIPIVSDPFVDPTFGSGAVKITPAHDPNDYALALRLGLPMINIMTPDGKINAEGGKFAGLTMEDGRREVVNAMQNLHFLVKVEPHHHRVGLSYRSKAIIEPFLSKQWFVRVSQFKQELRSLVEEKQVTLIPPHWDTTYFHWIDNLRDWCISRQLWWGHRIPIWYKKESVDTMICYDGDGVPPEVAANPENWQQDEDVLDTWFSAALWPFSTLGWPEKTLDLERFYPNSTLVTGHDILFFWVARMLLMGKYALGKPPFPETFLHGLIYGRSYWRYNKEGSVQYVDAKERLEYDLGKPIPAEVHAKWEKMSKSKGNVIDPLEIIDSFGTDAMRMALAASATQARQIDLDRRRFEEFKNFANKIWNGARFIFMNIESLSGEELAKGLRRDLLTLEDRWVFSLLNRTIAEVNRCLSTYAFDRAATLAYDFFWKEFCAYYLELTKPVLFGKRGTEEEKNHKQKILVIVLTASLRLLHPMAPFITEELFQLLKAKFAPLLSTTQTDPYTCDTLQALNAVACAIAPYPSVLVPEDIDPAIEEAFAFMDQIVHAVRNIRAEMQIPPGTATDLFIVGDLEGSSGRLAHSHEGILRALVKMGDISYEKEQPPLLLTSTAMVGPLKLFVPLPKEMQEKEKVRLIKEKEKLVAQQNQISQQLANIEFITKAPAQLVDKLKLNLATVENQLVELSKKLAQLIDLN
ncbi:MAG: valine--tRNA ligase [Simkania sp.]|nr:valine--tRNA ligase [Simkania sp.]